MGTNGVQNGIVTIELFFSLFILFWLAGLTIFFFKKLKGLEFTKDTGERETILEALHTIGEGIKKCQINNQGLEKSLTEIKEDGIHHIQKIGFVRFNPFADTGGEQSFVLSLQDGEKSGLVLTTLHGRSGTRWYAKMIKNGKSSTDLSKEEKEAINQAS